MSQLSCPAWIVQVVEQGRWSNQVIFFGLGFSSAILGQPFGHPFCPAKLGEYASSFSMAYNVLAKLRFNAV